MSVRVPTTPARHDVPLAVSSLDLPDLPEILAIERSAYARPWSREQFLQELRLPFSRVLVARARVASGHDRVVGYLCRWLTCGELHVLNVAVHPEWRRRSIGRYLVETALAEGFTAGVERAVLEVRRRNRSALRLYERVGFSQVGVRPDYYGAGEDALVMEMRLVPPGS